MPRIYVASSWRNQYQPEVVAALRKAGHEVYDFRNPKDNPGGFHWADVDENWHDWQPEEYIRNLTNPVAEKGFKADLDAMLWADTCVLVLPCGRSAHTEAGWFAGKGLKTIVYMPENQEPELMYKLFDGVVSTITDLILALEPGTKGIMSSEEYDVLREEMSDADLRVASVYGSIKRGIPKEAALARYGISEEFYDANIRRVLYS